MILTAAGAFPVESPYTGEQVGEAPVVPVAEVERLIELHGSTRLALSRYERAQILERTAERLVAAADELARLITLESGLCLKDTRYEVGRSVDVFRFAAAEALRDDGQVYACDTSANGRARRAYTTREPVRLVGAITPFNHPLNQVAHKLAPAIAAGSPILLKPSEKTPLSALRLARELSEAGLPPEACSVVTGDRESIVGALLAHPAVEVVAFTGSVAVGKAIAERLGYRRAVLELGGNDPLLVLAGADLDVAAALAVSGTTRNSGQRCTAVKRIIVDESVADALVERLVDGVGELVAGDPLDPATDVGTVIDEEAARTIERRIGDAVAAGAELLVGGQRLGALLAPAVLDRVPPEAELVAEETFGPVAPVLRVRGLDEAIALANATPFGLSAGVVSNDLRAITRSIRELRCGTVNVNEVPGYRTELTPFGGIKDSGLGVKEGVAEAMRAYTNLKLYTLPW